MDETFIELRRARESGQLPVLGSRYTTERSAIRTVLGLLLIVCSGVVIRWGFNSNISDEVLGTLILVGMAAFSIGVLLPHGKAIYLDVRQREVVKESWYAFYVSKNANSLAQYSKIVVRHVCHPGGEGEDTFTGSVGLKPSEAEAALWVKEFPANKDEITTEPDRFAKELSQMLGLPYAPP